MTQTDAARYAKYYDPAKAASRLMKKRAIRRRLAEQEKMRKKATQNALNQEAFQEVTTRRAVEKNLTQILEQGKTDSARVSAAMALAKINAWILPKPDPIADQLKGKSAEELEFIAINGRDPENVQELHAFSESRRSKREEEGSRRNENSPKLAR
jgi:hypothetical protein